MIILGITDGDDGGACLVKDGELIAAISEERLNRHKMSIGFPTLSIKEILRFCDIDPSEVDHVAMASYREDFTPECITNEGWFKSKTSLKKHLKSIMASKMAPYLGKYDLPKKIYHKAQVRINQKRKEGVPRLLKEMGIDAPISHYDHHYCHAMSVFDTSGFDSALTITLDGGGDGACLNALHL